MSQPHWDGIRPKPAESADENIAEDLKYLLRQVVYTRLPLGNKVIDILPEHLEHAILYRLKHE